jgi:hypothetical protein
VSDEELEKLAKNHADTAMYYEPEYTAAVTSFMHGYRAAQASKPVMPSQQEMWNAGIAGADEAYEWLKSKLESGGVK